MRPAMRRTAKICTVAAALTLVGAACSSDDSSTDAGGSGGTSGSGSSASGEVLVSGSSTVEPISTRVAELLEPIAPDVAVTVDGPGTGDGFAAFCAGETDISDASRPIKEEEMTSCADAGIEFIELKVAIDGIAVLTHPDNAVECLSFADLYALVGPESEGFEDWSDAQPLAEELGSTTQFPSASLDITAPGEESGTYDSFIELVFADIAEARVEEGKLDEAQAETTRPDYTSQGNDNAIIQGIEGSPSSLGWVGFAFAEEAGDGVTEIAISAEPGGECVAPTAETIASTEYPISRNLYIYVSAQAAEENPAVTEYVDFYLSDEGIAAVAEVGYVELPADQLEATRAVWEARETGTRDG